MPILLGLLARSHSAVLWAFRNPRLALELALVAALLFVGWRYNKIQDDLSVAKLEAGQLEDGLKQQIRIVNGQLEILRKVKGKVVVERIYLPPEGGVVVKDPEKPGDDVTISVKDRGFTLRPGMGLSWYGRGISPRLDLKLAYFKRYSLLLGGDKGGVDLGVSRHVDDILPWRPLNLEVFGGYRFIRMPEAPAWVFGLRLNF